MKQQFWLQIDKEDIEMVRMTIEWTTKYNGKDLKNKWLAAILHVDSVSCIIRPWQMRLLHENEGPLLFEITTGCPNVDETEEMEMRSLSDDWADILEREAFLCTLPESEE